MIGTKNRFHIFTGLCIVFMLLACQPVIAIGWREGLFIFVLIAILIGPPVYRFIRRIEEFRRHEKTDRNRHT
jgi:uncharacterized membrane protein